MGRHEDRLRPNNPWVPAGSGPGLKLCRLYEGRAGLVLKKLYLPTLMTGSLAQFDPHFDQV